MLPILAGKQPATVSVSERLVPVAELRQIYERRAKHLAAGTLPATFPSTLPDDVRALADALNAAEDERGVRIWDLALTDGTSFALFELVANGRLAGVVKSADQRIVAPLRR
ncbi:MAG: hypothetical protein ABSE49_34580 [Polyangiaceae bacterium]